MRKVNTYLMIQFTIYTEKVQECEKSVPRVIGITESKRKLLRIFTKIQLIII